MLPPNCTKSDDAAARSPNAETQIDRRPLAALPKVRSCCASSTFAAPTRDSATPYEYPLNIAPPRGRTLISSCLKSDPRGRYQLLQKLVSGSAVDAKSARWSGARLSPPA